MTTYTDSERLEFFFRGNIEVAVSKIVGQPPEGFCLMELVGAEDYIFISHEHKDPRDAVDEAITRKNEGLGEVDDPYRLKEKNSLNEKAPLASLRLGFFIGASVFSGPVGRAGGSPAGARFCSPRSRALCADQFRR